MRRRSLLNYSGYVFDLDGTIYLGPRLIEGVGETLRHLRKEGKKIRFLTNKPLQTGSDYARKLRDMGVEAEDDEVMNSIAVTTLYLLENHRGKRLYVVGEGPLIYSLVTAGFEVVDDGDRCDLVLLSFDRNFHYMKLYHAMIAARRGVPVLATNPDVCCPIETGVIPDCGAVIAAVEACSGRKIDAVIGKPSEIMLRVILEDLGLPADETLLVGDRLETDMKMGRRAGMATALVLSGVTSRDQLEAWAEKPDYALESAADILAHRTDPR